MGRIILTPGEKYEPAPGAVLAPVGSTVNNTSSNTTRPPHPPVLVKAVLEDGARAGEVEPEEVAARSAVRGAGSDEQTRLLSESRGELLAGESRTRDVHPEQIRRVPVHRNERRDPLADEIARGFSVPVKVLSQLVEPRLAALESGDRRGHCERAGLGYLVGVEGARDFMTESAVGNADRRRLQTRKVERLGRSDASDTVFTAYVGSRRERDVIAPGRRQIAVDLVGDHRDSAPSRYLADARERLFIPYLSDRVVRVAEDHQIRLRVGKFLFEIVKVHPVLAVLKNERILDDAASVV